jgi:putative tricarboxylic transport membrane protein
MFLSFTILSYIASGLMMKAFMMAGFGLLLGSLRIDIMMGSYRFSYRILALEDGLGLVPVVMGLFGVSEVLLNLEEGAYGVFLKKRSRTCIPTCRIGRNPLGQSAGDLSWDFSLAFSLEEAL